METGKINYSEFLAATIDIKAHLTRERLKAIFSMFDTDNSSKLTASNIAIAMKKFGHEIDQEEI